MTCSSTSPCATSVSLRCCLPPSLPLLLGIVSLAAAGPGEPVIREPVIIFFFSFDAIMLDSEWNTGDESTEAQSLDTWSVKYLHDDGSLLLVGPFWVCPSL